MTRQLVAFKCFSERGGRLDRISGRNVINAVWKYSKSETETAFSP